MGDFLGREEGIRRQKKIGKRKGVLKWKAAAASVRTQAYKLLDEGETRSISQNLLFPLPKGP